MRLIVSFAMTFAVAGALTIIAWPLIDQPDEPALTVVDFRTPAGPVRQSAWVGDDNKRNAILMSAVWGGEQGAE